MKSNDHNPIVLRPHHGLCIHHFVGKGYSPEFTQNMKTVLNHLSKNPQAQIRLHTGTDCLCGACPHQRRAEECASGQKVVDYDQTCMKSCGWNEGQILSWKEFCEGTQRLLFLRGGVRGICVNCEWLEFCEAVAKEKEKEGKQKNEDAQRSSHSIELG